MSATIKSIKQKRNQYIALFQMEEGQINTPINRLHLGVGPHTRLLFHLPTIQTKRRLLRRQSFYAPTRFISLGISS